MRLKSQLKSQRKVGKYFVYPKKYYNAESLLYQKEELLQASCGCFSLFFFSEFHMLKKSLVTDKKQSYFNKILSGD